MGRSTLNDYVSGPSATTVGNEAIIAGGVSVGSPNYVPTAMFDILSLPPAVTVSSPTSISNGTAMIPYTLVDGESNPCGISVQYSVNGAPWQMATQGTGGNGLNNLPSSPTGSTPLTFAWNYQEDLGTTNNPSVQVRIIPTDLVGTGAAQVSPSFAVNNSGKTNNLVITCDNSGDAFTLSQSGSATSPIRISGIDASGELGAIASNITSVSVVGGSGADNLNASNMVMPVTLNGEANSSSADMLIGGAGCDTFYYSGLNSTYKGGGGADNTIIYPVNQGDVITVASPEIIDYGTDDSPENDTLGKVSGIEEIYVSGDPASVNGTQQLLWPIEDVPLTNVTVNTIQGTGSITQSVGGWSAGSYTISFYAAQRGNNGTSVENFEVLVDGNVVGTFTPTGTSYQTYTTSRFTVSAGAHTIEFLGLDTAGGDNSVLIDDVSVAIAPLPLTPTVGDSGFESVQVGAGNFAYDPTGSAWSFSGLSGIAGNGSAFTTINPPAPQGSQVAFIQTIGWITQAVQGWSAGSYTISFDAAQRGTNTENFEVFVDGNVVGTFQPTGTSYQDYTTATFTVASGTHTIEFLGLDTAGGDNSALLDDVSVANAPLPLGPTVGDSGFESGQFGAGNFAYDPTGSAWTLAGLAGISGNDSALTSGNPAAPQGTQVAFITTVSKSPTTVLTAGFTDTNPNATVGTESATINWGDGTVSAGTIASPSSGYFTISASHIYATDATRVVYVTIVDSLGAATVVGTDYTGGLVWQSNGNLVDDDDGSLSPPLDTNVATASYVVYNPSSSMLSVEPFIVTLHSDSAQTLGFIGEPSTGPLSPAQFDSGVQTIQLGTDGTLYALHSPAPGQATNLDEFAPGTTTNPKVISNVLNIVEDSNGDLYRLDADHLLYELVPGGTWTQIPQPSDVQAGSPPPGIQSLSLDPNDSTKIDVLDEEGDYYTFDGAVWSFIAGPQFSVPALSPTAGNVSVPVTVVTMVDGTAVPDTGFTGTVEVNVTGNESIAPKPYSFTAADGGTHLFVFPLDESGTYVIGIEGGASVIPLSTSVTVAPGPIYGLSEDGPVDVTAGAAVSYTVAVVDQYGNPVPSYNGTVTLTTNDHNPETLVPGSVTLQNGTATFTATLTKAGSATITATDKSNSALQGTDQVTVEAAPILAQIGISLPPLVGVDNSFDVTFKMEDPYGNPYNPFAFSAAPASENLLFSNTAAFTMASTGYAIPQDGVLTIPMTLNVDGTQSFTVNYFVPDPSNPNQGTSTTATVTVQGVPPSQTTLSASAATVTLGGSETLTAMVTGSGLDAPTRTVSFFDGSILLGTGTLSTAGGVTTATLILSTGSPTPSTPAMGLGPNQITAVYSGDQVNPASTSEAVTVVVAQATQTTVAASVNDPVFGQPETFTATVWVAPGGVIPTGTVTFEEGSTILGTATLSAVGSLAVASITTTALPLGTDAVTAVYSGDPDDMPSTSQPLTVVVGQDATLVTLTASPNPVAIDQSVILTAVVTANGADTPGGSVSFAEGSTTLGTAQLSVVNGAATATLAVPAATLGAGTNTVTAAYSGDTDDEASAATSTTVTVGSSGQLATQTTLSLMTDTSGNVDLTATITSSGANSPGDTVSFYEELISSGQPPQSNPLGAPVAVSTSNGVTTASYTITSGTLSAGGYAIAAEYSGDNADLGSNSGPVALTIGQSGQIATQTEVVPEYTYLNSGEADTLTAVVSSFVGGGVPTGTVTFSEGSIVLGTATLTGPTAGQGNGLADFATAPITTTALTGGSYTIKATYSGAPAYLQSTSTAATITVGEPTTIGLSLSASTLTAGQEEKFTATVTGSGSTAPTGTVTFEDGGAVLWTAPLTGVNNSSATATFATSTLALGPQSITAVYGGDQSNQASTSAPVDFAVGSLTQNVTQTALKPPTGTLNANQPVNLSANVSIVLTPNGSAATEPPGGTVTFLDGSTSLGCVGLDEVPGGNATSFTSTINLDGSTLTDTQTVNTASGVASASASWNGSSALGTATVSTTGGTTTVSFTTSIDDSTVLGTETTSTTGGGTTASFTVTLNGSTIQGTAMLDTSNNEFTATLTTSALGNGYLITAFYSGDLDNMPSTAAPQILQIGQAPTQTSLATNSVVYGQPLTATVIVPGSSTATPTGTVTFNEITTSEGVQQLTLLGTAWLAEVAGVATATISGPPLAPGIYTIEALYSGDANDVASDSGQVDVTINPDQPQVSVTSSSQVVSVGNSVTLTAEVSVPSPGEGTPTGTVTFFDGSTPLPGPVTYQTSGGALTASVSFNPANSDVGTPTITVEYSGDADDLQATGSVALIVVSSAVAGGPSGGGGTHGGWEDLHKVNTVVLGPTTAVVGQPVTLTATVYSSVGGPAGEVTFYAGTILLGTATLGSISNETATTTLVTTSLDLGTNTVRAVYLGGGNVPACYSLPFSINVGTDSTQTVLTAVSSPGYVGQSETFDAAVTVQSPGSNTPTGIVTFYDGSTALGTAQLAPGNGGAVAAFTTTLAPGIHQISATYSGDTNDQGSSVAPSTFTVGQVGQNVTQTVLSPPSIGSPFFGEAEVFSATVTVTQVGNNPAAVIPTGSVTFFDGSTILGTAAVTFSNGVAAADLTTTARHWGPRPRLPRFTTAMQTTCRVFPPRSASQCPRRRPVQQWQ